MANRHPVATLTLALMLALQGGAFAAAPHREPPAREAMSMETPCSGSMDRSGPTKNCCDTHCPDMASCALGCGFGPATEFVMAVVHGPQLVATHVPRVAATVPPQSRLRPPITLPG